MLSGAKKGKNGISFGLFSVFYGCFLVTSIASTAIPTIMTMMTAAPMYMSVAFEANPVIGVAVGEGADGELA